MAGKSMRRFFGDKWTGKLLSSGWGYASANSSEVSLTMYVELSESDTTPKGHVGREVLIKLTPGEMQKHLKSCSYRLAAVNTLIAQGKATSPDPVVIEPETSTRYGIERVEINAEERWCVVRYHGNQGQKTLARYRDEIAARELLKTLIDLAHAEG